MRNETDEMMISRADLPGNKIDDEMVFFNQQKGRYFGTGPVGTVIWEFIDTPRSISEIYDHLLKMFDIDRSTCEAQVSKFISELLEEGIVRTER